MGSMLRSVLSMSPCSKNSLATRIATLCWISHGLAIAAMSHAVITIPLWTCRFEFITTITLLYKLTLKLGVIKTYKFDDFERFFVLPVSHIVCRHYPYTYRVYWSMIVSLLTSNHIMRAFWTTLQVCMVKINVDGWQGMIVVYSNVICTFNFQF